MEKQPQFYLEEFREEARILISEISKPNSSTTAKKKEETLI
jgi:hypothetical protein